MAFVLAPTSKTNCVLLLNKGYSHPKYCNKHVTAIVLEVLYVVYKLGISRTYPGYFDYMDCIKMKSKIAKLTKIDAYVPL